MRTGGLLMALVLAVGCAGAPRPADAPGDTFAAFVAVNGLGRLAQAEVSVGGGDGDPALVARAVVAADDATRSRGLKGVASLPDGVGMLFILPEPADPGGRPGFWMLDTLVPLDIAFVADGVIVGVATMTPCPGPPCPITHPGVDYDTALEVGAGVLGAAGVAVGDRLAWRPAEG